MTIGSSLVLFAVGAILKYAVTDSISGVDLSTVGVILMIVGIVGLLLGLVMMANARRVVDPYAAPAVDPRDRRDVL